MAFFDDIFKEIKDQVADLAKTELKDLADNATSDANDFLDNSKDKLAKWAKLFADHKIDQEELEFLVNSQLGLGEMKVLTNAGIAIIKAERFKNAVINIVLKTILSGASKLIKP